MPAESKGPRLWLKPAGAGGYVWIIKDDGGLRRSTGIRATRRGKAPVEAQDALARYVLEKRTATRVKGRAAGGTKVSDVIAVYMADRTAAQAAPNDAVRRCLVVLKWWGDKLLSDVTMKTCAEYVAHRGKPVARRELEDLRSAINYHAALGLHRDVVKVTLPPPGRPRMRWLTRDEAARLIWAAWRFKEVHQAPYRIRYSRRHIARFVLVALYTGSRAGAVCAARLGPTRDGGWIDLDSGVFHRRGEDEIETNKRRPPVRLSGNLLAHLRRWNRSGQSYAVEWCGKPIQTIEKGFARACSDAGLVGVSPHALRHTAATWQMQAGTPIWEAAGFLGMTTETLERVYGHHHPEFQRSAAENMRRKRPESAKRSGPSSGPLQKEKAR